MAGRGSQPGQEAQHGFIDLDPVPRAALEVILLLLDVTASDADL